MKRCSPVVTQAVMRHQLAVQPAVIELIVDGVANSGGSGEHALGLHVAEWAECMCCFYQWVHCCNLLVRVLCANANPHKLATSRPHAHACTDAMHACALPPARP